MERTGQLERALVLVAALAVVALAAPARGVEVDRKGKAVSEVDAKDWFRHPHDDSYYIESWTTILRSEQGHVVFITFLYSNIGVFSGSTGVSISLAMPGKQASHYVFDYPVGQFAQDEKSGRIAVSSHFMSIHGRQVFIRIQDKSIKMDITLDGWTNGVKYHDGMTYLDEKRTKWLQFFVHVPRGRASAEIVADGKTVAFTGDGYLDHWVQNVLGSDYSTNWWSARLFHPTHTVVLMVVKLTQEFGGRRFARLFVTDRSKVLTFTDNATLVAGDEKADPKGHDYATSYEIAHKGKAVSLSGRFSGDRMFDRDAILERMNAVQRQIVRMVAGNPVIYRLAGRGELELQLGGRPGVLLKGPALMESIVLGDD